MENIIKSKMQLLCYDSEIIKTMRDFLSQRHFPWYNCLVVISFVTVFVFSVSTSKWDANMKMSLIEETGNLKDIKHHCDWQSVFMVFLFILLIVLLSQRFRHTHKKTTLPILYLISQYIFLFLLLSNISYQKLKKAKTQNDILIWFRGLFNFQWNRNTIYLIPSNARWYFRPSSISWPVNANVPAGFSFPRHVSTFWVVSSARRFL